jgi:hypothetical protein
MQGNMWPARFSDSRSNEITRDVCLVLHVTPRQEQKVIEELLHESKALVGSES